MNVGNAIEKLQRITKEKEALRSEHKQRQEEEVELLRRIELKEELKKVEREGMLNIQSLVVRSLSHSSSSSECVEGKMYNEKMQFVQTIIHDIYKTGASTVKILRRTRRSWCVGLKVTLVDLVFIEELEEDEAVEQHFMEA
jgi:hypothetical protein